MRIAIPQWQGRIAPVFDVASHLLLVDIEQGREIHREERHLGRKTGLPRAAYLVRCGTNVLICGGVSASLQLRVAGLGIRVVSFICGTVDEVLAAYLSGKLASPAFAMPGCCRCRRKGGDKASPNGRQRGPTLPF